MVHQVSLFSHTVEGVPQAKNMAFAPSTNQAKMKPAGDEQQARAKAAAKKAKKQRQKANRQQQQAKPQEVQAQAELELNKLSQKPLVTPSLSQTIA